MISNALARVIATLNLLGLSRNPRLCLRSKPMKSSDERTVEMMITRRSCPWKSSVLPTLTSPKSAPKVIIHV